MGTPGDGWLHWCHQGRRSSGQGQESSTAQKGPRDVEQLFMSTSTAQRVPAPGNLVRWFCSFIPEWFGSLQKQGRNFPREHFLPVLGMWMVPCRNAGLVEPADLLSIRHLGLPGEFSVTFHGTLARTRCCSWWVSWEYLGMVAHFSQTSKTLGSLAVRQTS